MYKSGCCRFSDPCGVPSPDSLFKNRKRQVRRPDATQDRKETVRKGFPNMGPRTDGAISMEQEFLYNGTIIPVGVERLPSDSGERYKATVEGIAYEFGASRISPNELVLFINGSVRRVFTASAGDRILVHDDGRVLEFEKILGRPENILKGRT